jgi:serralysin
MSKTKRLGLCLTKTPPEIHHNNIHPSNMLIARAAFAFNVKWPDKYVIKVGFFKGQVKLDDGTYQDAQFTPDKAMWVKYIIEKFFIKSGLVNLSFEWDVPLQNSDIRIMFIPEMGAWSLLGTQATKQNTNSPTMNLGWIDNDLDYDSPDAKGTGAVVLHEFGHALGLIHEHSRKDASLLKWNKDSVYIDLGKSPNYWSRQEVDAQIFTPQEFDSKNSSEYDPTSIMHYYFQNDYFLPPPPNLIHAVKLSPLDIKTITNRYPGGGGNSTGQIKDKNGNVVQDNGDGTVKIDSGGGGNSTGDGTVKIDSGDSSDKSKSKSKSKKSWLSNNWYFILISIAILACILIIILHKNK